MLWLHTTAANALDALDALVQVQADLCDSDGRPRTIGLRVAGR